MPTSLYDLTVPTFLQTMRAIAGCLHRAATHCATTGANPDDFVDARLYPDMQPFHFQIEVAWHQSVWGVEAMKTGAFTPPALVGPVPFADLQAMIEQGIAALEAFTPEEVNSWSGRNLDIDIFRPVDEENASTSAWAARTIAFTPETFLLSYLMPNFYFHAVTAYDILRTRGVPIGKGDYVGVLRTRPA